MKAKPLLTLLGFYLSAMCAWGQYNVSIPGGSPGYTMFSDQFNTLTPGPDLNRTTLGKMLSPTAKVLAWNVPSQSFVVYQKLPVGSWTVDPTPSAGEGFYCIDPNGSGISVQFNGTPNTLTAIADFTTYPPTTSWYLLGSQIYPGAPYTYFDITGYTAPPAGVSLYRANTTVLNGSPIASTPFTDPAQWNEYWYDGSIWHPGTPSINDGEAVWIGPSSCAIEGTVVQKGNNNPIQNCEVSLSDGQFTFTDSGGNYRFAIPSTGGEYTVTLIPPCGWEVVSGSGSQSVSASCPGPTIVPPLIAMPANGSSTKPDLAVVVVYVPDPGFPDYPCPNDTGSYLVFFFNKCGPTPPTSTLKVILPGSVQYGTYTTPGTPSSTQIMGPAAGGPTTSTGGGGSETLTWTVGPMPAGDIGEIQIPIQVSPAPPSVLSTTATITPVGTTDAHPPDNTYTCSTAAKCASDPNSKIVQPEGCGPTGLINNQPLTYTIQFQNDGTAPAFQVVVTDQLDPGLDPTTLQILGASANYVFNLNGNQMTWTFPNIDLPDTNDDLAGSYGFISYQVQPLAGLADGTAITNQASIVFDSNPPVLTDTTTNTITSAAMPSASFTVTPAVGSADATNDFAYTGGTAGATFFWDFGPDAIPPTSTDMNPSGVVFPTNGLTIVDLQVSAGGCTSDAASYLLNVGVPVLNIIPADSNQFVLSWDGDGYSLQQAGTLTNPIPWQSFSQPLTHVGATYFTPPIGVSNVTTFFRLTDQP